MRFWGIAVTWVAMLGVAGCGGGSALTCDILQDPDNCWATAAAAATACLPPPTEVGVLAQDRTSCSFANGATVSFDEPLPTSTLELTRLGLTIEANGGQCARFVDTFENRMELTAGGQTVVSELHDDGSFHLHCGDGTTYESSFDLLFSCPAGSAPTDGFGVTVTTFELYITSVVTTPDPLFTCAL